MPFNVAAPALPALPRRPQTLDEAYAMFVGNDPLDVADWDGYEDAVGLLVRGAMPTKNGHHPDCEAGRYPMSLGDTKSDVRNGKHVVVCMHCDHTIGGD